MGRSQDSTSEVTRKEVMKIRPKRGNNTWHPTWVLRTKGDETVLNRSKVALFCSVKCPGKLILDTYDLAKRFRDDGITVISGFHSPMEQECLRILLRSQNPVIWCIARGLYHRIPSKPVDCRLAVNEGRLVMVTPFPDTVRYITAETATTRNRLVVELASIVVVSHAAHGGKMETLCLDILAEDKPLYTFDHSANTALIEAGAIKIGESTNWQLVASASTGASIGRAGTEISSGS